MKQYKVESYTVDRNLGYLIQKATGDTTQEILGYFYGICQFVLDTTIKKSKASGWTNKEIILFYKDTPISFRITIGCQSPTRENPIARIKVRFPEKAEEFEVADLMNSVVESGLGLTDESNLPLFNKPDLKSPACLKEVRIKQDESR